MDPKVSLLDRPQSGTREVSLPKADGGPALSPFLPGTNIQYAIDSTSLGYLKTCPRLYQYIMIEGWAAKGESVHLRFGIEFHKALEGYDHLRFRGEDHAEALRHTVSELLIRTDDFDPDPDTRAGKYKSRRNLVALVIDYLDHYKDDPAQTVAREDGTPAVELSFRFELEWGPRQGYSDKQVDDSEWEPGLGQPYLLSGHLDRVVSFSSELYVMDRKTSMTTLGPYYFNQYDPNNQMTIYTIAGQVIMGAPIKGVIIDGAQILLEKPNDFVRGFTYRTPDRLEEWFADLRITLAQAEGYAVANYWPQNDTACDKFGGCKFREICQKSPHVRERFLAGNFVKQPLEERWNPLKPR